MNGNPPMFSIFARLFIPTLSLITFLTLTCTENVDSHEFRLQSLSSYSTSSTVKLEVMVTWKKKKNSRSLDVITQKFLSFLEFKFHYLLFLYVFYFICGLVRFLLNGGNLH